jgi:hypothetical protein
MQIFLANSLQIIIRFNMCVFEFELKMKDKKVLEFFHAFLNFLNNCFIKVLLRNSHQSLNRNFLLETH